MLEKNINDKLRYISTINDENCKFICNLCSNYLKEDKNIDIKEYATKNNCTCNKDIESIITKCKKSNGLLIVFLPETNSIFKNINKILKNSDVKYVIVSNNDKLRKLDINKKVEENKCDSVFCYFQLDDINKWYNWNVSLEGKIKSIINKIEKISIKELKNNPKKYANEILLNNKVEKIKSDKNKFNIKNIINKIDKAIYSGSYFEKNMFFANISFSKNINCYYIKEFVDLMNLLYIKDNSKKYEYIYDTLCQELENIISKYNYCLFEENKCIAQRDNAKWPKSKQNGCCVKLKSVDKCDFLKEKCCSIKCISCRLFTCKYLKQRGIEFDVRKNLLVNYYLNILQKSELVCNFFVPKEKILHNLNRLNLKFRLKK